MARIFYEYRQPLVNLMAHQNYIGIVWYCILRLALFSCAVALVTKLI